MINQKNTKISDTLRAKKGLPSPTELPSPRKEFIYRIHNPRYTTRKIKSDQYKESLTHIQASLSQSQRLFSRFIHQPAVEFISEIASKTLFRPKEVLLGGAVSITGSIVALAIARYVGFIIPDSIFLILFLAGFFVGLLLEVVVKIFQKRSL